MDRTRRDWRLAGYEKRFLKVVAVWARKLTGKRTHLHPLQVQMPMDDRFAESSSRPECVCELEEQRSCGLASDEVRVRSPVEISDPDAEHILADDAHRPCVAQTKRSTGLPWNRASSIAGTLRLRTNALVASIGPTKSWS